MSPRSCLFCESPATSLEHVWPEWILKVLPERRPVRQKLGGRPEVTYRGDFKIRCVCPECNSGWMSDLEHSSAFLIRPLIKGIPIIITPTSQRLVSRWAMKMAMVVEGTKSRSRSKFFDQSARKQFKEQDIFPLDTFIWIGRSVTSGYLTNGADFGYTVKENGKEGFGSVTTLVAGRLVIQVFVLRHPGTSLNETLDIPVRGDHWDRSLIQIQPESSLTLTWPPTFLPQPWGSNVPVRIKVSVESKRRRIVRATTVRHLFFGVLSVLRNGPGRARISP